MDTFLMGTISNWRDTFITALNGVGRSYYNPVVPNWTPADGVREAEALATAQTVVMVITTDTESIGSLAESGWAVLSALQRNQRVGLCIELYSKDAVTENPKLDASQRARKLALQHAERFLQDYPDAFYLTSSQADLVTWLLRPVPVG